MKKYLVYLVFLLVTMNTQLQAQRFAYVDTDYILDMLPEYKSAQKQLDLIAETWQKEAEEKKAEIEKMLQDFQAEQILLTAELKKKKETDIKLKEAELKEFMNKKFGYEGELFKKRQELVKPIQDKVFDACQNIAKKSALDFIFAKGGEMIMMYSNARYDKSDEVLIELGVNVTKNKGNSPEPNAAPNNMPNTRPGGGR
ncbi:MAG: OmpH family outer membrane protein [Sphingobacteriales bacterium]|jgi:outer membrane protein|nr:OmpH family outer membrane protein [Sphingobacteriales bacterium]